MAGKSNWLFCLGLLVTSIASNAATDGSHSNPVAEINALHWVHGPAILKISDEATVNLPKGIKYLDEVEGKRFLEINGNPPSDGTYIITPEQSTWFAIYQFDPSGYVSDKEEVNPEDLFNSLKSDEQSSNERRKTLGMSGLFLDRWSVEPHYDRSSHNLEWGTEMHDESGQKFVNYTSRILGRGGAMRAVLVSDPKNLSSDLSQFRVATAGFSYVPTKRYEEFTEGDKMAAYGLGALVTGGAAAAVVKTGLLGVILAALAKFGAVFFKVIILGAVALFFGALNWFKGLFRRSQIDE